MAEHGTYEGCFGPHHGQVRSGFESPLQGEDFRQYTWVPGQTELPSTVQQLVDTGAAAGVSAVPYIYPILGFTRPAALGGDPWLYPRGGGKYYASLANREFQDYRALKA